MAGSRGEPPRYLLASQREAINEINIQCVANVAEIQFIPGIVGIVSGQLQVPAFSLHSYPIPEDISPVERCVATHIGVGGRVVGGIRDSLTKILAVNVSLQAITIASMSSPVHPESALAAMPVVVVVAIRVVLRRPSKPFQIRTVCEPLTVAGADAEPSIELLNV